MESFEIDKFTKCGFIYKSPEISDKCYIFLSCIHCGDISWDLKQFMCHSKYHQNHHPEVQRISGNLENQSGNEAITFCKEDLESSIGKGKEKVGSQVNSFPFKLSQNIYRIPSDMDMMFKV